MAYKKQITIEISFGKVMAFGIGFYTLPLKLKVINIRITKIIVKITLSFNSKDSPANLYDPT